MKKILILTMILGSVFILSGCDEKTSKYEKIMGEYATKYYNTYQKGTQNLDPKISIADLKGAVSRVNADFDMSKLSACTDESYVQLTLNTTNNEIEKITYYLQCEE